MPLPQRIDAEVLLHDLHAFCAFIDRWQISEDLAYRLVLMASKLEFGLSIISGHRSEQRQNELRAEGRPTADNDLSTHLSCPATGADLMTDVAPVTAVKARFGHAAVESGLRWGGGSPVGTIDSEEPGIPSDWPHVDTGPRMN